MKPEILVGFDFSSASKQALAWAVDLQRTLEGKPVHVTYVVNPLPEVTSPETASLSLLSPDDLACIRASLEEAVKKVSETATCELVVSGAPGAAIVEEARLRKSGLVVLGTHGRGALSRFFVGSVAEYVLRHSVIPVLTIREPPSGLREIEAA